MKKGDGRIKFGCSDKPKTPNFGSVFFSFFIDLLKTSNLIVQNQWVNTLKIHKNYTTLVLVKMGKIWTFKYESN